MEKKIKHLEMIQEVIKRMSSNSFTLKGLAVTLISGIFVLAAKDTEKMFLLIAYLPIVMFWWLDSYYLRQEKLYRALFDTVRELPENKIDFSMIVTQKEVEGNENKFFNCFFSKTEIGFYLPLIVVSTVIVVLSFCK